MSPSNSHNQASTNQRLSSVLPRTTPQTRTARHRRGAPRDMSCSSRAEATAFTQLITRDVRKRASSANANAPQRVIESAHSVPSSNRSCRRRRQPDRIRICASSQLPNHNIEWNHRPRWSEPQPGWWHADTNARTPPSEPTLQIGSTPECQTRSCGVATARLHVVSEDDARRTSDRSDGRASSASR